MDLEVLQPGEAPAAAFLVALEGSLARVHSDVSHQLVLGVEWLGQAVTVLK